MGDWSAIVATSVIPISAEGALAGLLAKVAGKAGLKLAPKALSQFESLLVKIKVKKVPKTGEVGWSLSKGGGMINGRKYSQHALERMAPNTIQVRAELTKRAQEQAVKKGFKTGTREYSDFIKKYVDPRNIPPMVVENAIKSTKAIPGNSVGTFVHETSDVRVIINNVGDVITVIPK
ncbi:hypothetical protein [Listeria newyorkensis]|uniref:hypothetical protein n=1 Tax=Listeria newyorkensis TaxID=1497681 RepID=UPI0016257E87|nr:hypothetical protein [Listeria newyorkensis]